jgi:hypothetical protein
VVPGGPDVKTVLHVRARVLAVAIVPVQGRSAQVVPLYLLEVVNPAIQQRRSHLVAAD